MTNIADIVRAHQNGWGELPGLTERQQIDMLITEISRLTDECGCDQRNAAQSQEEASKLFTRVTELTLRHIGCLPVLNAYRRETANEDTRDRIDRALSDASSIHPTMDIHQMRSGDWWIEPRR